MPNPNNSTGRFGGSRVGRGPQKEDGKFGSHDTGSPSLPKDGRLQRSGSGQPNSASPSMSQTHGQTARDRPNSGRPKNLTGFDKKRATGTLINDIRIKRLRAYMHNPMKTSGEETDTNRPSQLPSNRKRGDGENDPAIPRTRTTPPGKTTRRDEFDDAPESGVVTRNKERSTDTRSGVKRK